MTLGDLRKIDAPKWGFILSSENIVISDFGIDWGNELLFIQDKDGDPVFLYEILEATKSCPDDLPVTIATRRNRIVEGSVSIVDGSGYFKTIC
jgi:hypothetical protein